ncbi:hypothetical protein ABFA25_10860 [Mycobacterium lepromatosis]|uniref:hypothetical protein n=1 Tax=Mycobacterium lepromatosis TaxID=480418 RepID=UPI0012DFF492|nr:hypothetical protein [Mycobacterium lepromatosis]
MGTCLNSGYLPTKMVVYITKATNLIQISVRDGTDVRIYRVRWDDIVSRGSIQSGSAASTTGIDGKRIISTRTTYTTGLDPFKPTGVIF